MKSKQPAFVLTALIAGLCVWRKFTPRHDGDNL